MRKTRLSIRRGGVVGVTSPAQCSLTVLWQVAFHHQHQSITPPPASATTREKFAWNYLSRCDGGWATQGEAVSTFRSGAGSCLHLAIIFIFWTYVLSLNQRLHPDRCTLHIYDKTAYFANVDSGHWTDTKVAKEKKYWLTTVHSFNWMKCVTRWRESVECSSTGWRHIACRYSRSQ